MRDRYETCRAHPWGPSWVVGHVAFHLLHKKLPQTIWDLCYSALAQAHSELGRTRCQCPQLNQSANWPWMAAGKSALAPRQGGTPCTQDPRPVESVCLRGSLTRCLRGSLTRMWKKKGERKKEFPCPKMLPTPSLIRGPLLQSHLL